jgi:hypothetical protein
MMTAPSTMRPKSMAPRLIRLPLVRVCTMPIAVSSIDSGIASAVMIAARKFPSMTNRTTTTSSAPSARLRSTVRIVASTSIRRSSTVFARTSGGRVRATSCILRSTAAATVRLFAPTSMKAVPTDDLLAVLGGAAGPELAAHADRRDVAHAHRRALPLGDDDLGELLRARRGRPAARTT